MVGVPSPPSRMGCWVPGMRLWVRASPGCRSAQCDVEAAGFSSDQGVFVMLCGGQRACRVQLAEIIFEHAFNIRLGTDIPRKLDTAATNRQHQMNPDNTCAHDMVI
jgi:hypothetical protein